MTKNSDEHLAEAEHLAQLPLELQVKALDLPRAPANDPKLVTAIVIERGGHGGVAGALTALDFYSKVFKVKRPNLGTIVDRST